MHFQVIPALGIIIIIIIMYLFLLSIYYNIVKLECNTQKYVVVFLCFAVDMEVEIEGNLCY